MRFKWCKLKLLTDARSRYLKSQKHCAAFTMKLADMRNTHQSGAANLERYELSHQASNFVFTFAGLQVAACNHDANTIDGMETVAFN